jgi:hypothetical protein
MVAVGNRSVVSRWADHRSSKLGAWPVVSGAAVLASGKLTTGALSGVVLWSPEGAPDLSYCCGVSCWANATPEQMSSAVAKITNCFLKGVSSGLVGSRGKRPASLSGSSSSVAVEIDWTCRECRSGCESTEILITPTRPHSVGIGTNGHFRNLSIRPQ